MCWGVGDLMMARSNPIEVKMLLGCSGAFGVNERSMERARTSVVRCSLGSMFIVANGCDIWAVTSAGRRAVANCLAMMLCALPLWLLEQLKMWSP